MYSSAKIKLVAEALGNNFESDEFGPLTVVSHNQSIQLDAGWHMIGVPLDLYDPFYENLFPEANVADWTMFDSEGDFSNITIDFSKGYYLALSSPEQMVASGVPITSVNMDDSDIVLSKGWNLFSHTLMTDFSKYDIDISYQENTYEWHEAVNVGLISPTIYRWNDNLYDLSLIHI